MKNTPLISVIVPAYNCQRFIKAAIDSLLSQSYERIEILIADDASTDGTKKMIDDYQDSRIKRFHNLKNLGYLKTCNKLFALASGELMAFQDADDLSAQNRFEVQLRCFQENEDIDVCGSNMHVIDEAGNILRSTTWGADINGLIENMQFDFIPNSFLFRKSVYEQIGGYHPYFDRIGFEDFYWTATASRKFKLINTLEHLYYYRTNPDSVSNNFTSFEKTFSYFSLLKLLNQHKETGTDYLSVGKEARLKGEVYLKMASHYLELKEYQNAIKAELLSLRNQPASLYTYRTLLYTLRRMFTSKL